MESESTFYQYSYAAWAEAFSIFAKYAPETLFEVVAAKDIVYAGSDADKMTPEDAARIAALGWTWDAQYNCFYRGT